MNRMRNSITVAVIHLVLAACSGRQAGLVCECPAGWVCIDGECAQVCVEDLDCESRCCSEQQVCVAECVAAPPEIHAINGTGPADADASTAPKRVLDRLIIDGASLYGSIVQLTNESLADPLELEVCEGSSDKTLIVMLPSDIAPGEYTLSLLNQKGSCSAQVMLMQGEQGATGSPGTIYVAGTGLKVEGSALSVDTEFILETMQAAKPSMYNFPLTPVDFKQSSTGALIDDSWEHDTSSWNVNADRMYSVSALSKATARLPFPDGAQVTDLACLVENQDSESGEAGEVEVALYFTNGAVFPCPDSSATFGPVGTLGAFETVPVHADCNVPIHNDVNSEDYRMYFVIVTAKGGPSGEPSHRFRRCRVQYTLP